MKQVIQDKPNTVDFNSGIICLLYFGRVYVIFYLFLSLLFTPKG